MNTDINIKDKLIEKIKKVIEKYPLKEWIDVTDPVECSGLSNNTHDIEIYAEYNNDFIIIMLNNRKTIISISDSEIASKVSYEIKRRRNNFLLKKQENDRKAVEDFLEKEI